MVDVKNSELPCECCHKGVFCCFFEFLLLLLFVFCLRGVYLFEEKKKKKDEKGKDGSREGEKIKQIVN